MLKRDKIDFLEPWRDRGFVLVVLHRLGPWMRRVHNFRRYYDRETPQGVQRKILWYPFVCWQPDEYFRASAIARKEKRAAPVPDRCPFCRMLHHLDRRTDIADDQFVFDFVGHDRRARRQIEKGDFLHRGTSGYAFQDDATPQSEWMLPVIPIENPVGVVIAQERWTLGVALSRAIEADIKTYQVERGDPMRSPIGYRWVHSKNAKPAYTVGRIDGFEPSSEIVELWRGPGIDASSYCRPSNPHILLAAMKSAAQFQFPWRAIFEPSTDAWGNAESSTEDGDDPADVEHNSSAVSSTRSEGETACKPASTSAHGRGHSSQIPERQEVTRSERLYPCTRCGKDWPESYPSCPHCGNSGGDDSAHERNREEERREYDDIPF